MSNTRRTPLAIRFEKCVQRSDDPAGCWDWTGCKHSNGYGVISSGGYCGPLLLAHRVAYELKFGPIPTGLCVLHRCDNPPCTNPAHLFVGTRVENMKDMCAKGRHFRSIGELSASAKLTEAQVLEIRRRYAAGGVTQLVLAREFEVGETAIKEINRRETWSHI